MPALRPLTAGACALALSLSATALLAPVARSQTPPAGGMPSKQQIEREIQSQIEKIPDEKTELPDVASLAYKPVPADVATAFEDSGQQLPPGTDVQAAAKQYGPFVKPSIEKACARLGTLTVKVDLKLRSTRLAAGDYQFGLIMDEMNPVGVAIMGGALKRPLQLPLKPNAAVKEPFKHFKCEVRAGKAAGEVVFWVGFGVTDAVSTKLTYAAKK